MPTYTHVAVDRLLEPGSRITLSKPPPAPVKLNRTPTPVPSPRNSNPRRQMAPALYATPETTPVPPDSPSSPSSYPPASPYIINHKRRGPRLLKSQSLSNSDHGSHLSEIAAQTQSQNVVPLLEEEEVHTSGESLVDEMADVLETEHIAAENDERGRNNKEIEVNEIGTVRNEEEKTEKDEILDLQESMSIASEDGYAIERSWKPSTPIGEFYDAFEEISSEGGGASIPSSKFNNIDEELREIRLSLLMEIEKRKQAEEAAEILRNQWLRLSHHLSLLGLHLPPPPPSTTDRNGNSKSSNFELDPVEELYQQIIASRLVSDAIAKSVSRIEVETEMEPIFQSKNFEISRLMDRVQYYEAANREMSQRNQEAVEMARQQRLRRKRRQKWILASIGLAATLGSAAIAWSYLPSAKSVLPEQDSSASGPCTNQN